MNRHDQPASALRADETLTAIRNRCLMRLLERVAQSFNEASVPLLVLKGAALNLTVYEAAHERPMVDLDVLIQTADIDRACTLLEQLGCVRGGGLVREDFFPRFYYEVEYYANTVYPMKIDLHVRPFPARRYAQLLPDDALWDRAERISFGRAAALIPSAEDMLIHLAVHAASHGYAHPKWERDLRRWVDARRTEIDWARFLSTVAAWRVALPVREALRRVERESGDVCPAQVLQQLDELPATWRDRLALWQAPRDAAHPSMRVLVNALCTPGWRFNLGYLRAVVVPGRAHIGDWYGRRHPGWLPLAHLLRWSWPVVKHVRGLSTWFTMTEVRQTGRQRMGLFAARDFAAGQMIARSGGRLRRGAGGVGSGRLRFLHRSCRPNAELGRRGLVALRAIPAGTEITICHADAGCRGQRTVPPAQCPPPTEALSDAA